MLEQFLIDIGFIKVKEITNKEEYPFGYVLSIYSYKEYDVEIAERNKTYQIKLLKVNKNPFGLLSSNRYEELSRGFIDMNKKSGDLSDSVMFKIDTWKIIEMFKKEFPDEFLIYNRNTKIEQLFNENN